MGAAPSSEDGVVVYTTDAAGNKFVPHRREPGWFRDVVHTTKHAQIVFMELARGEKLPGEIHEKNDQIFIVTGGTGYAQLRTAGSSETQQVPLQFKTILMVDAGTWHEIDSVEGLTLVTIYAVPNHKDGTRQRTNPELVGPYV